MMTKRKDDEEYDVFSQEGAKKALVGLSIASDEDVYRLIQAVLGRENNAFDWRSVAMLLLRIRKTERENAKLRKDAEFSENIGFRKGMLEAENLMQRAVREARSAGVTMRMATVTVPWSKMPVSLRLQRMVASKFECDERDITRGMVLSHGPLHWIRTPNFGNRLLFELAGALGCIKPRPYRDNTWIENKSA